jgi:hypothetical protein
MFRNVATKIALFAFDTTTGAAKTGDSANLTAYVSKDYGAVTVLTDTTATEMDATNAKGWYLFDVTQTESNADVLLFTGKSSTANISLVGQYIHTTPNRFTTLVIDAAGLADANAVKVGPTGSGTAQTARDIGASVLLSAGTGTGQLDFTSGVVKSNVTQWLGTTVSTPTVAGIPNVNAKTWNDLATVALPLVPTTAGRTLDVSATGEAGVDWANVGSPTTSVNLSGTTIATTQKVDVETIKTNPVVNAGTITFPTTATLASTTNITAGTVTTATNVTTVNGLAANVLTAAATAADFGTEIATAIWQDATAGDFTVASSIGKALYTGNVVPGGAGGLFIAGSNAATTVNFTGSLSGSVGSVTGAVGSVTGNVGGNVTGSVGSVTGAVGSVTGAVGSVTGNVGGNVTGTIGGLTAAALKDFFDTDSTTTYASAVAGSVVKEIADNAGGASLTVADIVDGVWDEAIAGHVTSGSTGEALSAAGGAGDPWITALPGAYSAGQAGYIVGTNINATVSSRATQTSVDTIDDFLDTEIAAIKAKTDNLPADPADASDIASSFSTVNTKLDTIDDFLDTEVAAIKAKTDSLTFTVAGMVDSNVIDWKGATAPAMTGDAFARLGAPAGASVSADVAAVKSDTAATLDDTGTSGVVVAAASKTGYRLSSTGVDDILRTTMTEGYAADGATFTLEQATYMVWSMLAERSIAATTLTAKKLDGSTAAMTFTLDDAVTPTSQTRAT